VARAGNATVFPQAIALAATFDAPLMHQVADIISTEFPRNTTQQSIPAAPPIGTGDSPPGRPTSTSSAIRAGVAGRKPTGKIPYLTASWGSPSLPACRAAISSYIKVVATPKHFAVTSGPESTRHTVDVTASRHDMEDTYLPAFRATVTEAHAQSVMLCLQTR